MQTLFVPVILLHRICSKKKKNREAQKNLSKSMYQNIYIIFLLHFLCLFFFFLILLLFIFYIWQLYRITNFQIGKEI